MVSLFQSCLQLIQPLACFHPHQVLISSSVMSGAPNQRRWWQFLHFCTPGLDPRMMWASLPASVLLWVIFQIVISLNRSLMGLAQCFSGGSILNVVGDSLISAGVNIQSLYGTTETGPLCRYGIPRGNDWAWMEIWDKISVEWYDQGNGIYKCHCLVCEVRLLWKFILQLPLRKENCTSLRLLIEAIRKAWFFRTYSSSIRQRAICGKCTIISLLIYETLTLNCSVGRQDDVVIHSSGMKTLPGPMEEMITSSPL